MILENYLLIVYSSIDNHRSLFAVDASTYTFVKLDKLQRCRPVLQKLEFGVVRVDNIGLF